SSPGNAVAIDAQGDIYFADTVNNRVREVSAASGIIQTVAGTGAAGFSGDGGPATAAQLYRPLTVALDAGGDLYIGDRGTCVREVDAATGIITTVAGSVLSGH